MFLEIWINISPIKRKVRANKSAFLNTPTLFRKKIKVLNNFKLFIIEVINNFKKYLLLLCTSMDSYKSFKILDNCKKLKLLTCDKFSEYFLQYEILGDQNNAFPY